MKIIWFTKEKKSHLISSFMDNFIQLELNATKLV